MVEMLATVMELAVTPVSVAPPLSPGAAVVAVAAAPAAAAPDRAAVAAVVPPLVGVPAWARLPGGAVGAGAPRGGAALAAGAAPASVTGVWSPGVSSPAAVPVLAPLPAEALCSSALLRRAPQPAARMARH